MHVQLLLVMSFNDLWKKFWVIFANLYFWWQKSENKFHIELEALFSRSHVLHTTAVLEWKRKKLMTSQKNCLWNFTYTDMRPQPLITEFFSSFWCSLEVIQARCVKRIEIELEMSRKIWRLEINLLSHLGLITLGQFP